MKKFLFLILLCAMPCAQSNYNTTVKVVAGALGVVMLYTAYQMYKEAYPVKSNAEQIEEDSRYLKQVEQYIKKLQTRTTTKENAQDIKADTYTHQKLQEIATKYGPTENQDLFNLSVSLGLELEKSMYQVYPTRHSLSDMIRVGLTTPWMPKESRSEIPRTFLLSPIYSAEQELTIDNLMRDTKKSLVGMGGNPIASISKLFIYLNELDSPMYHSPEHQALKNKLSSFFQEMEANHGKFINEVIIRANILALELADINKNIVLVLPVTFFLYSSLLLFIAYEDREVINHPTLAMYGVGALQALSFVPWLMS